jgi:HprK-related kinase A
VTIGSLTLQELAQRLENPGLHFQTGQFQICVQSSSLRLAKSLHLLYSDYPLAAADGFTDFHVNLNTSKGLRRWLRPQVIFEFDGALPFKPLPADQIFPLMEWGLNWCVSSAANSFLIIHAAVIEKNGCAAILPAPPGSGKSTLCAALINHGWRLLSDELTLVRVEDGQIIPLPRPVSLKNASIDIMQKFIPEAVFSPKVFDTVKGTIAHLKPPTDSIKRSNESAKPAWIIFPKYEAGAKTELTSITPAQGFLRLADNSFNYSPLGIHGFRAVARLMDMCTCHEFTYSVMDEAIAAFAALADDVGQK